MLRICAVLFLFLSFGFDSFAQPNTSILGKYESGCYTRTNSSNSLNSRKTTMEVSVERSIEEEFPNTPGRTLYVITLNTYLYNDENCKILNRKISTVQQGAHTDKEGVSATRLIGVSQVEGMACILNELSEARCLDQTAKFYPIETSYDISEDVLSFGKTDGQRNCDSQPITADSTNYCRVFRRIE